jgi:hypothetical protein
VDLEADLAAIRPHRADPLVVRKCAEERVVGGREVLIDGELVLLLVGGHVHELWQGGFLVEEDQVSQILRRQLEDDRWRGVFLGWQDEDVVNQQMRVRMRSGWDVAILFGGLEDGIDDVADVCIFTAF